MTVTNGDWNDSLALLRALNERDEPIDAGWWAAQEAADSAHESEHGLGGHQ